MIARVLCLVFFAGCAASDVVAIGICTRASDCMSGVCSEGVCAPYDGGGDAADGDATDPDASDGGFCAGSGPLVFVGDSSGTELCAGEVAQTTFRYALCTCNALALASTLVADAFDSRQGPYTQGEGGAAVGIDGSLSASGTGLSIGGALAVSGTGGVSLSPTSALAVRGDLSIGGPLMGSAAVTVLSDARIAGNVSASTLSVGGALTVPSGRSIDVSPGPLSVGSTLRAPVTVPPPCDCGPSAMLDVGAFVAEQTTANDNATIGLSTGELSGLSSDTSRTLPCGRYYLDAITTTPTEVDVTLAITGRVALFIGGNVEVHGDLTITVAPGAELDLFIAEDIAVLGVLRVGDPAHAARSRVYVGGTQAIALSAQASIAANFYAPTSTLQISGALEVYGSLFAKDLAASDAVTVHYDRAVLGLATQCEAPSSCTSCLDCQNQACGAGGVCGPCQSDADCCGPLECVDGACMVEIL